MNLAPLSGLPSPASSALAQACPPVPPQPAFGGESFAARLETELRPGGLQLFDLRQVQPAVRAESAPSLASSAPSVGESAASGAPGGAQSSGQGRGDLLGGLDGRWEHVHRRRAELDSQSHDFEERLRSGELRLGSPQYEAEQLRLNRGLMSLMTDVQHVQFQMELASKLVDHGTSGARTVLQTQA